MTKPTNPLHTTRDYLINAYNGHTGPLVGCRDAKVIAGWFLAVYPDDTWRNMLRQQPPWLESINREVRVDAMAMVMIALTGNPAWYVLTGAGRPFDSTPREFFDALQAEVPLDPERLAEYHQWVASQFEALRPFDAIPPA